MRIHHFSCGSFCPPLRPLTFGGGKLFERGNYVVHCLLIELPGRLVLVDTGLSRADMDHPLRSLGMGMTWGGGVTRGESALEHVKQLGYSAADVSDILMTHLDKDHAGGLRDFPQARVHVHPAELRAAQQRRSFVERQRYQPAHFAHGPRWEKLQIAGTQQWNGLEAVVPPGFPDNILIVLLPGHSAGHCGVAFQREDGRWLLHCGDAVYHSAWLEGRRPPLAIQAVESLLQHDGRDRRQTREKLVALVKANEANVFCSHDPVAFRRFQD